jgi:hypothetical protein
MPANCRLLRCNWLMITGASTEMVSRLTKLIGVARKMRPAIHQRSPGMPGLAAGAAGSSIGKHDPSTPRSTAVPAVPRYHGICLRDWQVL